MPIVKYLQVELPENMFNFIFKDYDLIIAGKYEYIQYQGMYSNELLQIVYKIEECLDELYNLDAQINSSQLESDVDLLKRFYRREIDLDRVRFLVK